MSSSRTQSRRSSHVVNTYYVLKQETSYKYEKMKTKEWRKREFYFTLTVRETTTTTTATTNTRPSRKRRYHRTGEKTLAISKQSTFATTSFFHQKGGTHHWTEGRLAFVPFVKKSCESIHEILTVLFKG